MLWYKRRKLEDPTHRPQHIRDYDLSALEEHFLFWDYLEIGKIHNLSSYSNIFINKIRTKPFVSAICADYLLFLKLYWN